jgi:hypothetical protein
VQCFMEPPRPLALCGHERIVLLANQHASPRTPTPATSYSGVAPGPSLMQFNRVWRLMPKTRTRRSQYGIAC